MPLSLQNVEAVFDSCGQFPPFLRLILLGTPAIWATDKWDRQWQYPKTAQCTFGGRFFFFAVQYI